MMRLPPGEPGNQERLAVLEHDGRRHRRKRAFAGAGKVGVVADQAVGVGGTRFRGEIVKLVVEQNAGAFGDEAKSIGKIQRVGVRHRVAVAVDDREMRGVPPFEVGGLPARMSAEGVARSPICARRDAAYFFDVRPATGILTASGSPMKTARSSMGALHRLDHVMKQFVATEFPRS